MRKAYGPGFINLSWQEVKTYFHFEPFGNDVFTVANRVYRQQRAVAIGGMVFAQMPCVYCMMRQHALGHLFKNRLPNSRQAASYLLPLGLMTKPFQFQFRDNIVGVMGNLTLPTLQKVFKKMLELTL